VLTYSLEMLRGLVGIILMGLIAVSCGGSEPNGNTLPSVSAGDLAAGTCLAGDPDCADGADGGAAAPLPSAIAVGTGEDEGPLLISFGGFFYSDGTSSQLCSALAESFPPQCGSVVIDLEGSLDTVLNNVAESFGNPDDAKINIDQGIYWTDDWVNLSGTLQANRLVLE